MDERDDDPAVEPGSGTGAPAPSASGAAADDVDEVRIGLSGIESVDPVAASPASVPDVMLADLFYDGLTTIGPDGAVAPALADFAVNADGTVWRFQLHDDATFADNSPVTAADVVFSLERIRARGGRSLAALRLEHVVSIEAVGESAVDITVDAPSAVLPELLSSPLYAITDRESIEPYLTGGDQTPNGSGDFVVTLTDADTIELERRRGTGPARVVVELFGDQDGAFDAFLADDVDWAIAPVARLGEAIGAAGAEAFVPFHGGLFLGIDDDIAPLDDPRLRRAIALAVDRRAVVDAVFGPAGLPLSGIVPAGVAGAATSCIGPCGPDPTEAARIVAEVFPDGQGDPLRLLIDDSAAQQSMAGIIEEQLEAVGLALEVSSFDVTTYEELIAAGQQQLFLFGSLGVALTPASHIPPLFESTSADNVTGLADESIDAAIAAARAEQIAQRRATAWQDVERRILEAAVAVPLVQFRTTGVLAADLAGFVVGADGSLDLSDLRRETPEES